MEKRERDDKKRSKAKRKRLGDGECHDTQESPTSARMVLSQTKIPLSFFLFLSPPPSFFLSLSLSLSFSLSPIKRSGPLNETLFDGLQAAAFEEVDLATSPEQRALHAAKGGMALGSGAAGKKVCMCMYDMCG